MARPRRSGAGRRTGEIKHLAADAKLTAKLEGELAKLVKDVGYTEPKAADPPKKP